MPYTASGVYYPEGAARSASRPTTGPGSPGWGKPLGIDPGPQTRGAYTGGQPTPKGWGLNAQGAAPRTGLWSRLGRFAKRSPWAVGASWAAPRWGEEVQRRRELPKGEQFVQSLTDPIPGMDIRALTGFGLFDNPPAEERNPSIVAMARGFGMPADLISSGVNWLVGELGGDPVIGSDPVLGSNWILENFPGWTPTRIKDAIQNDFVKAPSLSEQLSVAQKGVSDWMSGVYEGGKREYGRVTDPEAEVAQAGQEVEEAGGAWQSVVDGYNTAMEVVDNLFSGKNEEAAGEPPKPIDLNNLPTKRKEDETVAKGTTEKVMEDGTSVKAVTEKVSVVDDLLKEMGIFSGGLSKNMKSVEKTYAQLFAIGTAGGVGTSAATGFMNSSLGMMRLQQQEKWNLINLLSDSYVTLYPYTITQDGEYVWTPGGKVKSVLKWKANEYVGSHSTTAPQRPMTTAGEKHLNAVKKYITGPSPDVWQAWNTAAALSIAPETGALLPDSDAAIGSFIAGLLRAEYPHLAKYLKMVPVQPDYEQMVSWLNGKTPAEAEALGTLPEGEWEKWVATFGRWVPGKLGAL